MSIAVVGSSTYLRDAFLIACKLSIDLHLPSKYQCHEPPWALPAAYGESCKLTGAFGSLPLNSSQARNKSGRYFLPQLIPRGNRNEDQSERMLSV